MSEAALAPSSSQRAHLAPARARRNRLSPLEALERGFALFRSTFAREAWRYYTGAAPLVFCFIPMWVVNGQIRISDGALLREAALLAGGYLLRVWMVGSYMQRVREGAFGTPTSKPAGAAAQAAAVGRLLAWKIMLSAGALTTLPSIAGASWFYSACQFASLSAQEDGAERHSLSGCLALASQWFGGGLLLFLMLFPFWIAVWLNGLIVAMILPQLLHSIFGVNTLLSTQMGVYALVQSSAFWLSLFSGAWLALDPIVKCTFAIVYQHLRSRREGDDLRGLLASLPREQQKKAQMFASHATGGRVVTGALFVLATILAGVSLTATARAAQVPPARSTTETPGNSAREARIQRLRQALDEESQRAIYRWHDAEHPSPPTWFDNLLVKIGHSIEHAWNTLWNFLRKLWPSGLSLSLGSEKRGDWQLKDLRLWLTLVAILTLAAAGVLFWLRQRTDPASLSIPLAVAPIPDLSGSAAASERSEDEWFALASRLEGEGELRLALRAAYFGLLAGLEQREWLTIRRDRTNREYLNEFTRRWRRRPQATVEARAEIPEKLRGSLRQFDRVWYGSHALTPEAVTAYRQYQREFLNHV
ncbi:MAG TPA: DUF4129 domain-containing protein [Terriglobales bacterium]|nr:DUF4129 domain-containing protein [Terriglobales bacterium]